MHIHVPLESTTACPRLAEVRSSRFVGAIVATDREIVDGPFAPGNPVEFRAFEKPWDPRCAASAERAASEFAESAFTSKQFRLLHGAPATTALARMASDSNVPAGAYFRFICDDWASTSDVMWTPVENSDTRCTDLSNWIGPHMGNAFVPSATAQPGISTPAPFPLSGDGQCPINGSVSTAPGAWLDGLETSRPAQERNFERSMHFGAIGIDRSGVHAPRQIDAIDQATAADTLRPMTPRQSCPSLPPSPFRYRSCAGTIRLEGSHEHVPVR